LDPVELCDTNLVASSQKVIRGHHFDIFLAIELRQVINDVLAAKSLSNRQIVHHQALCDLVKDRFSNIQHLLFSDLHLVVIILVLVSFCIWVCICICVQILVLILILILFVIFIILIFRLLLAFLGPSFRLLLLSFLFLVS